MFKVFQKLLRIICSFFLLDKPDQNKESNIKYDMILNNKVKIKNGRGFSGHLLGLLLHFSLKRRQGTPKIRDQLHSSVPCILFHHKKASSLQAAST